MKTYFRLLVCCAGLIGADIFRPALAAQEVSVALPGSIISLEINPNMLEGAAIGPNAALVSSRPTETELEVPLEIGLALKMRDGAELQERINAGVIIPRDEMVARYWPTETDYDLVSDWAVAQGLSVGVKDSTHLSVFVTTTASRLKSVLGMSFVRVSVDGVEYTSASTAPVVPARIATALVGINGLQPHLQPKKHSYGLKRLNQSHDLNPAYLNTAPYFPDEMAKAYNSTGLSGSGQTIAIIIDTFPSPSDIAQFCTITGIPAIPLQLVQAVAGINAAPEGEETLDVEWSGSMAPGATVRVYASTNLSFVHLDQAYQVFINELSAIPSMRQVSMSYGLGEKYASPAQMNTDSGYFLSMAAAGVSVFVSSGDGGSSPSSSGHDHSGALQAETPASDVNVTAVGGTTLGLNSSTGAVTSETAWIDGGGAPSSQFNRPVWQMGTAFPSGTTRLVPDVAAAADPNTGAYLRFQGAGYQIGGTSWSSPMWAGFSALINRARVAAGQTSGGLLNPKIYPLLGSANFRDITSGTNGTGTNAGTYSAGTGYDLCTGVGVPNVANLIGSLTSAPVITSAPTMLGVVGQTSSYQITATSAPMAYGFSWISAAPGIASFNVNSGLFSISPSVSGAYSFTVAATNATGTGTQNVNLAVSGRPVITSSTSVTCNVGQTFYYPIAATNNPINYGFGWIAAAPGPANFNPTTGVLALTPTASGTFTFTVAATNTFGSGTQNVTLTVLGPPSVTSPATMTAYVGKTNSYQISGTNFPTTFGFDWIAAAPGSAGFNPTTGTFSITPTAAGTYSFTVSATNSAGSGTQTVALQVVGLPTITSTTTISGLIGVPLTYQILSANNPTVFGFGWIAAAPGPASFNAATGLLTLVPSGSGIFSFTVIATNGAGSASQNVTLTVGTSPVITSSSMMTGNVGQDSTYQVTATNSPTSFGFNWINPAAGRAYWDPSTGLFAIHPIAAGTYSFNISATNAVGTSNQVITLTVVPALTITSSTVINAAVGQTASYQITATDSPNLFGFGWITPAAGAASFNPATGLFRITPLNAGSYSFTAVATNAYGTDSRTVILNVGNAPVITGSTRVSIGLNQTLLYSVTATGAPTNFGFGWISPVTGPASFNTTSGLFSVTPSAPGTYTFTIVATNLYGSTSQNVTLNVVSPPAITSANSITTNVGLTTTIRSWRQTRRLPTVSAGFCLYRGAPASTRQPGYWPSRRPFRALSPLQLRLSIWPEIPLKMSRSPSSPRISEPPFEF